MKYRFNEFNDSTPHATTPEWWDLDAGRIAAKLPGQPFWVHYYSIVRDPDTRILSIDTNDNEVDPTLQCIPERSIPVMHIYGETPELQGYIADLRYHAQLLTQERPEYAREKLGTIALIAAVFADDEGVVIRGNTATSALAMSLMDFTDTHREQCGLPLITGLQDFKETHEVLPAEEHRSL